MKTSGIAGDRESTVAKAGKPLMASVELPLYGKRVVVTAPRTYAARLAAQLIEQGGLPLLMPAIETCWLEDYAGLDAAIAMLPNFDWIAFTSRNGVDAFYQRLHSLDVPLSRLARCRLCALGQDGERLRSLGLEPDLIPADPSPAGAIAALAQIPSIEQQTVLVPAPEVCGLPEPNVMPNFIAGLQQLGLTVTRVPAYRTRPLPKELYAVELDLIRAGKVDAIAFSSTAEVESFLRMVDGKRDSIHGSIACFGPYTAANARAAGLDVEIVSEDYSAFVGFAAAIAKKLAPKSTLEPALCSKRV